MTTSGSSGGGVALPAPLVFGIAGFCEVTITGSLLNEDPISGTHLQVRIPMPTAVSDAEGGIWLFWVRNRRGRDNIWYVRRNIFTQTWSEPRQITSHTEADTNDENPFVLLGPDGSLWLFWNRVFQVQGQRESALFYRRIIPSI